MQPCRPGGFYIQRQLHTAAVHSAVVQLSRMGQIGNPEGARRTSEIHMIYDTQGLQCRAYNS
jgi:hypothetical protein